MYYDIRKGWPSQAAVDESFRADTGQVIKEGMIVTVADGKASVANFTGAAAPTDPMCAFVFGHEDLTDSFTGLMSQGVIEVDADLYEAASYKAGDPLTAKNGKFAPAGSSKVLGRVLSVDVGNAHLRIMWHEAK